MFWISNLTLSCALLFFFPTEIFSMYIHIKPVFSLTASKTDSTSAGSNQLGILPALGKIGIAKKEQEFVYTPYSRFLSDEEVQLLFPRDKAIDERQKKKEMVEIVASVDKCLEQCIIKILACGKAVVTEHESKSYKNLIKFIEKSLQDIRFLCERLCILDVDLCDKSRIREKFGLLIKTTFLLKRPLVEEQSKEALAEIINFSVEDWLKEIENYNDYKKKLKEKLKEMFELGVDKKIFEHKCRGMGYRLLVTNVFLALIYIEECYRRVDFLDRSYCKSSKIFEQFKKLKEAYDLLLS